MQDELCITIIRLRQGIEIKLVVEMVKNANRVDSFLINMFLLFLINIFYFLPRFCLTPLLVVCFRQVLQVNF